MSDSDIGRVIGIATGGWAVLALPVSVAIVVVSMFGSYPWVELALTAILTLFVVLAVVAEWRDHIQDEFEVEDGESEHDDFNIGDYVDVQASTTIYHEPSDLANDALREEIKARLRGNGLLKHQWLDVGVILNDLSSVGVKCKQPFISRQYKMDRGMIFTVVNPFVARARVSFEVEVDGEVVYHGWADIYPCGVAFYKVEIESSMDTRGNHEVCGTITNCEPIAGDGYPEADGWWA